MRSGLSAIDCIACYAYASRATGVIEDDTALANIIQAVAGVCVASDAFFVGVVVFFDWLVLDSRLRGPDDAEKISTCTIQKSNSMQVVFAKFIYVKKLKKHSAIPGSADILPAFSGRDARAPRVLSSFGVAKLA